MDRYKFHGVHKCEHMLEVIRYDVTQRDFRHGSLICTACCVMYSQACSMLDTAALDCGVRWTSPGVPTEDTMVHLFQFASSLHGKLLEHYEVERNDMFSVSDILRATHATESNKYMFHMKEIHGCFNEEVLNNFNNVVNGAMEQGGPNEEPTQDPDKQECARQLLQQAEDVSIYSLHNGIHSFLHKGGTAILTLQEHQHTVAIHRCVDGTLTLFDPLTGTITRFDSTETVVAHFKGMGLQEEFNCYFSESTNPVL
jgi:hypothetical protein